MADKKKTAQDFVNDTEDVRRDLTRYIKGHIGSDAFTKNLVNNGYDEEEAAKIVAASTF